MPQQNVLDRPALEAWLYEPSDSSTAEPGRPEKIAQQIEALFEAAKEERFEDGMESEFSNELISLVEEHGSAAIHALTNLIISEGVNAEVVSEALRWIGWMDTPLLHHDRLWLLVRSLDHSSARVRDGAVLGIASMDDPDAIPYLRKAIQREGNTELRKDMEQVLVQLENTTQSVSSKTDTKGQVVQA
jgi:hypothetical protein